MTNHNLPPDQSLNPLEGASLQPQFVSDQNITTDQTVAAQLGLDDDFQVVRSNGEVDNGWAVEQVGVDLNSSTGKEEQFVLITKPKLDDNGVQKVDSEGNPDFDAKSIWLSKLQAMQTPKTVESGEITEAEVAIEEIGETAVGQTIEVDYESVDVSSNGTTVDSTEIKPKDTIPAENLDSDEIDEVGSNADNEQKAKTEKEKLIRHEVERLLSQSLAMNELGDNGGVANAVHGMMDRSIDYPEDVKCFVQGVALGTANRPRLLVDIYSSSTQKLLGAFGEDAKKAISFMDYVVNARVKLLSEQMNDNDTNFTKYRKNGLLDELYTHTLTGNADVDPKQEELRKRYKLALLGMALGMSEPADKRAIATEVEKTILN